MRVGCNSAIAKFMAAHFRAQNSYSSRYLTAQNINYTPLTNLWLAPSRCNFSQNARHFFPRRRYFFSDISKRNNDYSDTLDFRRGRVGKVGLVTFFVLEIHDYESAMLIYFYIYKITRSKICDWLKITRKSVIG